MPENANRVSSKSITIPKAISPINQKYRPKLTKFFILLVITKRSRLSSSSLTFDRSGIGNSKSSNTASFLISRQVDKLLVKAEIDNPEIENSVIDSLLYRAKRTKTGKRDRKGRGSLDK